MIRRSIEWFLGSVVVYLCVAACAAGGGIEGMMQMATGGLAAMLGGDQGSGAEGSDGQGAESSGAQASDGSGAMGADGEGATGGVSIIDPVPNADAAEDGTRIVNLYRTTTDGLKTAEGYFDKELGVRCSFAVAEDGKERCLPPYQAAVSTTYFSDSGCTVPLAASSKSVCPAYAYFGQQDATLCSSAVNAYKYLFYQIGTKQTAGVYQKSSSTAACTEADATVYESADFYQVTKLDPASFVEGTLGQGDP